MHSSKLSHWTTFIVNVIILFVLVWCIGLMFFILNCILFLLCFVLSSLMACDPIRSSLLMSPLVGRSNWRHLMKLWSWLSLHTYKEESSWAHITRHTTSPKQAPSEANRDPHIVIEQASSTVACSATCPFFNHTKCNIYGETHELGMCMAQDNASKDVKAMVGDPGCNIYGKTNPHHQGLH